MDWRRSPLLTPETSSRLEAFATLVHTWNPRINLTGYKTIDSILEDLIGESVLALQALSLSAGRVLDFGSGAGIPGLVWAICRQDLQVTSLEIREKKVAFQKEVLRKTGLQAEIVRGMFPDAVRGRSFDCIVTRATRFDPKLWGSAAGLLAGGGILVHFAAKDSQQSGWSALPVSAKTTLLVQRST